MGIEAIFLTLIFLFRSWSLIHYKFYVSLNYCKLVTNLEKIFLCWVYEPDAI